MHEMTPSGTHSAYGIAIQEVSNSGAECMTTEMASVAKDRKKTVKPDITELRPCFPKPKADPNFVI